MPNTTGRDRSESQRQILTLRTPAPSHKKPPMLYGPLATEVGQWESMLFVRIARQIVKSPHWHMGQFWTRYVPSDLRSEFLRQLSSEQIRETADKLAADGLVAIRQDWRRRWITLELDACERLDSVAVVMVDFPPLTRAEVNALRYWGVK